MLISIHDVPRYERHLLFCSKLDPRKPRRRRRHARIEPALDDRPFSMTDAQADEVLNLIPIAAGFDAVGTGVGAA